MLTQAAVLLSPFLHELSGKFFFFFGWKHAEDMLFRGKYQGWVWSVNVFFTVVSGQWLEDLFWSKHLFNLNTPVISFPLILSDSSACDQSGTKQCPSRVEKVYQSVYHGMKIKKVRVPTIAGQCQCPKMFTNNRNRWHNIKPWGSQNNKLWGWKSWE